MAKTIVTGGAGFIGSHLTELLLQRGHQVLVLDNLSTGRLENLAHLKGIVGLSFHQVELAEFQSIRPLFDGVDWVFHLAGLADIVPSMQRPLEYHRANVDGTAAVAEAARRAEVKRLVYANSSMSFTLLVTSMAFMHAPP